jgi:hypothetical protein
MPGLESLRHSFGRLPARRPAAGWIMWRSCIEPKSGDHREGMAVPCVDRDPFARSAVSVSAKLRRAHRHSDQSRPGQGIGYCPRTVVAVIVKGLVSATKPIRLCSQLIRGPDRAFNGQGRIDRRQREAISKLCRVTRDGGPAFRERSSGGESDRRGSDQRAQKQNSDDNSHGYLNSAGDVPAGCFSNIVAPDKHNFQAQPSKERRFTNRRLALSAVLKPPFLGPGMRDAPNTATERQSQRPAH